jgi:hypothetical protein
VDAGFSDCRVFQERFMKKLLPAFIVMSAVVAVARPAAADIKRGYYCHTPNIADGGFVVRIETDGPAGTARVDVSRDSIGGPRALGSYAVRVTQSGSNTVFQGNGLMLTMDRSFESARFVAKMGAGGILATGDLRCSAGR